MVNDSIDTKNKLPSGVNFKISRFKEIIKKTKPHKHDAYSEFIFLFEGEGFHTIESEQIVIKPPVVFLLEPGQLHYWQFSAIPKGYVILFNRRAFDPLQHHQIVDTLQKINSARYFKMEQPQMFSHALALMENEYTDSGPCELLYTLFSALLQMLEKLQRHSHANIARGNSIYESFTELLPVQKPILHKVNEYARLVHTSPQNLNSLCRKYTGKAASTLINEQIMLEAKRQILHSNNNVNEISDLIGFSDVSNFVKFFKRHSGMTPVQFRNQFFQ